MSRDDLLSAELAILKELEFDLMVPTQQDVHLHLQKYLKIRDILTDEASAAKYEKIYMKVSLYVA